jgi:DNA-binding PadR family transcriptional regulator
LFLALLSGERAPGYELKQSLEQGFGDLLPALNAGQIYVTLGRLERDGLVAGHAVPGDSRGKREYELTDAGREALAAWIEAPVSGRRLRDLNGLLEANGKGPAAELLVEGFILHLKADLEWLELIEGRLPLKEEG